MRRAAQTCHCMNWVIQWNTLNAKHILSLWHRFKGKKALCKSISIIRCNISPACVLTLHQSAPLCLSGVNVESRWQSAPPSVLSAWFSAPSAQPRCQRWWCRSVHLSLCALALTLYALLDFLWHLYFLPEYVSRSNTTTTTTTVKLTRSNGKLMLK